MLLTLIHDEQGSWSSSISVSRSRAGSWCESSFNLARFSTVSSLVPKARDRDSTSTQMPSCFSA